MTISYGVTRLYQLANSLKTDSMQERTGHTGRSISAAGCRQGHASSTCTQGTGCISQLPVARVGHCLNTVVLMTGQLTPALIIGLCHPRTRPAFLLAGVLARRAKSFMPRASVQRWSGAATCRRPLLIMTACAAIDALRPDPAGLEHWHGTSAPRACSKRYAGLGVAHISCDAGDGCCNDTCPGNSRSSCPEAAGPAHGSLLLRIN